MKKILIIGSGEDFIDVVNTAKSKNYMLLFVMELKKE